MIKKRGNLLKDKRGIEGLPMHLIIIVVIAVAVLAAVLAMMKYVTFDKPMEATCLQIRGDVQKVSDTDGYLVKVNSTGSEKITNIDFTAYIKVYEKNSEKPVSGATVTIVGAGAVGSGKTNATGIAKVKVENAELAENQDEVYLKIEVKASGYQNFVDEEGLLVIRVRP
ncbi:MAG: hypothetical protein QXF32_02340 [Candidatus Thermoplasmatota archaeon]